MFGLFNDSASQKVKLLRLMSDGKTVTNEKLAKVVGPRFSARICQLKKAGCRFSKTVTGNKFKGTYKEFWKLEHVPDFLHYESSNVLVNERKKYFTPLQVETVGKLG